jgi:3-isopropylmalate/(R)-2-methylmalate dehydratase small subunit
MTESSLTRIVGRAVPLRGDNIDTDRIIPARFLRSVRFDGLEAHLFEDDRQTAGHPFAAPAYRGAAILLVNANFGCGSSREHAPQAIQRWGIRAVVGESFSEIFFGNATTLGLPCVTAAAEAVEALMRAAEADPATEMRLDLQAQRIETAGAGWPVRLPPAVREAFITGAWDATRLLLDRYEDVERTRDGLPYLNGSWQTHRGPAPTP